MSDEVDLDATVTGPDGAPVVVLLHAIGTARSMWDPQAEALATTYRLVRPDLRGHGCSPAPDGPYSIAGLGADVLRLLDRLGIERASLCGLSLGAMVGIWLAANAPQRVERLVACCAVARATAPADWTDRAAAVRTGGVAAIADLVVQRWGYSGRDATLEGAVREMLAATPAEGYAASCEAISAMDLRPGLPRISAPTLLVAGADDPAAPPTAAASIAWAIPASRLTIVDGAAHLANVEQPAAVTAAILGHLRELTA